jgi:hypothetical protein
MLADHEAYGTGVFVTEMMNLLLHAPKLQEGSQAEELACE